MSIKRNALQWRAPKFNFLTVALMACVWGLQFMSPSPAWAQESTFCEWTEVGPPTECPSCVALLCVCWEHNEQTQEWETIEDPQSQGLWCEGPPVAVRLPLPEPSNPSPATGGFCAALDNGGHLERTSGIARGSNHG